MFNYTHSFVHSFDKSVDDVSLRRMRDKYLCRVSDTFVYLAPCLTGRSSYSFSSSVLFYSLIKMLSKCRVYIYTLSLHGIVLQYTNKRMINKHREISTFWKVFFFNCIVKFSGRVMQAVHHYRIRPGKGTQQIYNIFIIIFACLIPMNIHLYLFDCARCTNLDQKWCLIERKRKRKSVN
jgi:hypothetical protein